MDYIEGLIEVFEKHAKEFDKSIGENKILHNKFWPEDALPDHLEKPFNLSWALWAMCKEIQAIKDAKK